MNTDERIFPAKLLLFGEHVLLLGATALAIPLTAFGGKWAYGRNRSPYFEKMLSFAGSKTLQDVPGLDVESFEKDLQNGLYFDSNIPTGYGLGSSGAFCAAVYQKYVAQPESDPGSLKSILAKMEGYFHGSSSGIDPLTSYLNAPVIIRRKTEVELAEAQKWEANAPVVFLIDSNLPRSSQKLIDWFLAQSDTTSFARFLQQQYLVAHEAMVAAWLSADVSAFWENIQAISAYQWNHFSPMIPETLKTVWKESLDHQQFTLKICGAGGGGFVLGFARSLTKIPMLPAEYAIHLPLETNQSATGRG